MADFAREGRIGRRDGNAQITGRTDRRKTEQSTAIFGSSSLRQIAFRLPSLTLGRLTTFRIYTIALYDYSPIQRYRLVGVGLSNFRDPETIAPQSDLFA